MNLTIEKLLAAKKLLDSKVAEPTYFPTVAGEWKFWNDLTQSEKDDLFEANKIKLRAQFSALELPDAWLKNSTSKK